jgi:YD repeat-containing protein
MSQFSQMNQRSQLRFSRFAFISFLLTLLLFLSSPAGRTADQPATAEEREREAAHAILPSDSGPSLVAEYHGLTATVTRVGKVPGTDRGGISEEVPAKYVARYQQWKKEFLATETGRQQWDFYQNNTTFTLTVVVTRDNPEGGTTSNYKWNEAGKLVAATITLGSRLDAGVPNPVYFPVMNSLLPSETTRKIDGETLAATKMAHEFGHVGRTAKGDSVLYQLQSQLMPQYNQIFLSNGRNAGDQRLIELAQKMGGTPVEIWEDREYWGETNAMLYLRDRFAEDGFRCLLFSRIKRSVDLYAPSYEQRFLKIAQSAPSGRHCGW